MNNKAGNYKKVDFDNNGNPVPYEFISLTLADIEYNYVSCFPESATRQSILESYKVYCDTFIDVLQCDCEQWINGSFTTQKQNPADIDLSILLDVEVAGQKTEQLRSFLTEGGSKQKYCVDAYLIPTCSTDSKYFAYCMSLYKYWREWWGKDRSNNPKAIIVRRIVYEKKQ